MLSLLRVIRFALIALLIAPAVNAGTETMRSLENAQETSADMVTFPSSDTGYLYFKNCPTCNEKPLQLTVGSQFIIGTQPVTLLALKKALSSTGEHFLTVFYAPTDRHVTRVVVMVPGK
jgi:hypothetical protein